MSAEKSFSERMLFPSGFVSIREAMNFGNDLMVVYTSTNHLKTDNRLVVPTNLSL
jgi:hypothetical protein